MDQPEFRVIEADCTRIEKARTALDMSPETAAARIGLNRPSYYDLESYSDEAGSALSIPEVIRLCQLFDLRVKELFPKSSPENESRHPLTQLPDEFIAHVTQKIRDSGQTFEEYSDVIGWEIQDSIKDSASLLDQNVDFLSRVCASFSIDLGVLLQYWVDHLELNSENGSSDPQSS